MEPKKVFISLGGNIGDTQEYLYQAVRAIQELDHITEVQVSRFYNTSPVSSISQRDFINAACTFNTTLTAQELATHLKLIEKKIGKTPKGKEEPRVIDLDIILFGLEIHYFNNLIIPHPHWRDRLFVLVPLSDLTRFITVPLSSDHYETIDLIEMIANHPNPYQERIIVTAAIPTALYSSNGNDLDLDGEKATELTHR